MTTKTIDTATINQSIDLRDLAAHYTTLHRESTRELAGPCPRCGGTQRFHCQVDWFFCRDCHPKRGDAIEFVCWKDGVTFKEAVATLTGAPMPAGAPVQPRPKRPAHKPATQSATWQEKTAAIVAQAQRRLFDDTDLEAEQGRIYLESRGLEPHTWQAFKIGFRTDVPLPNTWDGKAHIEPKRPAIVIPWFRGGKLCGIRYRFLAIHSYTDLHGTGRTAKKTAEHGSDFTGVLYGGQAIGENNPEFSTLVIVEGEENCQSIWQASRYSHLDVLSLGSETATITPAMIEFAGRFATVIVWMDKAERAQAEASKISGAFAIQSGNALDANDQLQAGRLGAYLAAYRFSKARNWHEQQHLLSGLADGARVPGYSDVKALAVIAHIRKTIPPAPIADVSAITEPMAPITRWHMVRDLAGFKRTLEMAKASEDKAQREAVTVVCNYLDGRTDDRLPLAAALWAIGESSAIVWS